MSLTDLRQPQYARTNRVLFDIFDERRRQDEKWGDQSGLPDGNVEGAAAKMHMPSADHAKMVCEGARLLKRLTWAHILVEEVCEAIDEVENRDPRALREELVQIAAVATAWIEAIDKRKQEAE